MSAAVVVGCSSCERGWRHCHEVWVLHRTVGECTGAEQCEDPAEAHELVVLCTELDPACSCA